MDVVEKIESLQLRLVQWRNASERIALVPTMGDLHDGHLQLVDEAARDATKVVVSLFVNPAQFGEGEDFSAYPRGLQEDIRKLGQQRAADLLFAPSTEEIYPRKSYTTVIIPEVSDILCGTFRPGHFSGVATVVLKLFNLVQPDVAVFGEKDYQQLVLIRRMVSDLNLPVAIRSLATVRESDGLAMSSRNRYLTPWERQIAPRLYAGLCDAAREIRDGFTDFEQLEIRYKENLRKSGFRPDYFSVRRDSDLQSAGPDDRDLVILAAAWLGKARLIDNQIVRANW